MDEARPMAAYKTPHQSKENQCQNGVVEVKVQGHDVAADFSRNDEAGYTGDQSKMEETCGQIPNANGSIGRRGVHKESQLCKKKE
jgi:hypothetical protein